MGEGAFRSCESLVSVTISEGVPSIADKAFEGCSGLSRITIPSSVYDVGARAFYGCGCLTNIIIPDGVIRIGGQAFGACGLLESITIPKSVTSIGGSIFWESTNIKEINLIKDSFADAFIKKEYPKMPIKYIGGSDEQTPEPTQEQTSKTPPANDNKQAAVPEAIGTELTTPDNTAKVKVTSSDASNPTVSYVRVINKKTSSVIVMNTVTINNITYKVTSIENNAFSGNKKNKKGNSW